ncbi:MAG: DinB family protein [Anaerolineaceae bacterium]|jgi:uncharacterized damage-inducible protein DinB
MPLKKLINYWQQVRAGTLATIDKFTDEDLSFTPFEDSWNVAQIMLHIAQEELGEVKYGLEQSLTDWPDEFLFEEYAKIEAITNLLDEVHAGTEQYISSVQVEDLQREIITPWSQTVHIEDMLLHTIEHEIHHRGELSLILGLLGRKGLDA